MSQENVEIVRRAFEEFRAGIERGNPGAPWDAGLIAADSEWIMPVPFEGRTVWRGREGFVEIAQSWMSDEFEDWSFRLERLIDAGDDRVVVLLHQSARGKASGAPVEAKASIVYQLRDRRVIRMWGYFSHAEALEAAGLRE
jgi:ketosteroid isomerase-like protein